MTEGQRLAAVQLDGHKAIDDIYLPLSRSIESLILRSRTDPNAPIPTNAIPFLLSQMQRLLSRSQLTIAQSIVSSAREAEVLADPVGTVDENALLTDGYAAITSLRRNQAGVMAQTSSLMLRGLSITDTAKLVQQYFSPWFATRRNETGRQVRASRVGLIKSWPGEAGMASQRARLLMLTETSAGHTRGMLRRATREERLLRYTLSLKHLDRDACDENAKRDMGFGPGLYLADDLPVVPAHWGCRCYAEAAEKVPFPVEQMAITGRARGFPIP